MDGNVQVTSAHTSKIKNKLEWRLTAELKPRLSCRSQSIIAKRYSNEKKGKVITVTRIFRLTQYYDFFNQI